MSLAARGLAYACALLVAFGAIAPWATIGGEPVGTSPVGLAVALAIALAVTAATAAQQRLVLRLLAVVIAALAVVVLWALPRIAVVESALVGPPSASMGNGLSIVLLGGVLLYAATWLPAPRTRVASADA